VLSVNSGGMSIAFDGTCWYAGVRSQTGSAMRGEDVGCPIKVVLPMPTQIARNHPGSLSVAPTVGQATSRNARADVLGG
jgi:hypothetical protein